MRRSAIGAALILLRLGMPAGAQEDLKDQMESLRRQVRALEEALQKAREPAEADRARLEEMQRRLSQLEKGKPAPDLDPGGAAAYDAGCAAFQRRVDEAMFGPKLLER